MCAFWLTSLCFVLMNAGCFSFLVFLFFLLFLLFLFFLSFSLSFWMNSALWHCVVQSSPEPRSASDLRFITDICVACVLGDSSLKSSFLFALCKLLPSAFAYDVSVSLNSVSRILDSFAKQFQRAAFGFVVSVRPCGAVRASIGRIFVKSCVGDFCNYLNE